MYADDNYKLLIGILYYDLKEKLIKNGVLIISVCVYKTSWKILHACSNVQGGDSYTKKHKNEYHIF